MTSAMVFTQAATTETGTTILSFDSADGFTPEFNSNIAIETTVKTEGTGSARFGFTIPTGQASNIGGMLFYDTTTAMDLSAYDKFSLDVYVPLAMEGQGGYLQVNFVTDSSAQDGYNYNFDLADANAGWNTVVVDKSAYTAHVNDTSWSSIKRLRITWFNAGQISREFFLLDNLCGVVVTETEDPSSTPSTSTTGHTPYATTDGGLMINNADSLDGWDVTDLFNTGLSAGTQVNEGSGSVALTSTIPTGQTANIGAMAMLNFPATDLSSYDNISMAMHFSEAMTGTHQIQINFITGSNSDGYNHVYTFADLAAGWHTISIDKSSLTDALGGSTSWASINRIRFAWYNHAGLTSNIVFTIDAIKAFPDEVSPSDPTVILPFDSLTRFTPEFNTSAAIETTVMTEGSGSMRMGFNVPTGQSGNVGGMLIYDFASSRDLSASNVFTLDIYSPIALSGQGGAFQVNFVTDSTAQDGFNFSIAIDNLNAGWNTITFYKTDVTSTASGSDWTNINRIRLTWFNLYQITCEFFLLDNLRGLDQVEHTCAPSGSIQYDDTYHWYNCATVGCGNLVNKEMHNGGEATCSAKAVCSVCGVSYGYTNASNHVNTETRDAVTVTCGADGYSGDVWCTDCNTMITQGTTIAATGNHTGGVANCSAKAVCVNCGQSYGELDSTRHLNTEVRDASETYTGDTWCTDCNTMLEEGTEIVPKPIDVTATVATVEGIFSAGDEIAIPITIGEWANAYATIDITMPVYDETYLTFDGFELSADNFGGALNASGPAGFALIASPSSEREALKVDGGEVCVMYFVAKTDIVEDLTVSVVLTARGYSVGAEDNWVAYQDLTVENVAGGIKVGEPASVPTLEITASNNVAASQNLTIDITSEDGIAGFYFGTSATYSDNEFISTSDAQTIKAISAAGTYYITAKSASGAVSETKSITFYSITLNANGGSVDLTNLIIASGNTVTLPQATRAGFAFVSWGTSASATSGVTSITATANATYYALWLINSFGDYDGDGTVDNTDALYVIQVFVGLAPITADQAIICDVDGNGIVDNVDALYVLQFFTEKITSFPIEN